MMKLGALTEIADKKWFVPAVFFTCFLILLLRKSDPIFWLQPFAEDGMQYLYGAIAGNWIGIFTGYVDYVQLIPNIIAFLSFKFFGLASSPLGMYIGGNIVAAVCSSYFATKNFRFIIRNDILRYACSVFMLVIPIQQIYDYNIGTLDYFITVFVLLFTLKLVFDYENYENYSLLKKAIYSILLSFSFLSSVYCITFIPIFLYVLLREKSSWKHHKSAIFSLVVMLIPLLFQLVYTVNAHVGHGNDLLSKSYSGLLWSTASIFFTGASKVILSNSYVLSNFSVTIPVLIGIAIYSLILLISKSQRKIDLYIISWVLVISFLMSAIRIDNISEKLSSGLVSGFERYFFYATFLTFLLIMRRFDGKFDLKKIIVLCFFGIVVTLNVGTGFHITPFPDVGFGRASAIYSPNGTSACFVPISPPGYYMELPCMKSNLLIDTKTDLSIVKNGKDQLTLIANVSPKPSAGNVEFLLNGKIASQPVPLFDGQAKTTINLQHGTYLLQAKYDGYPDWLPSNSQNTTVKIP